MTLPRYEFTIELRSPLVLGTGMATRTADDSVPRGIDGAPFIPAPTIKGATRDAVRTAGVVDADLQHRAFGRPTVSGRVGRDAGEVLFSDAVADGVPRVDELTTVALTEYRTARTGALATVEAVRPMTLGDDGWQPQCFRGSLLAAPDADDDADVVVGLALAGLATLRSFGSRTRRGWGEIRVRLAPDSADAARQAIASINGTGAPS